MQAPAYLDLDVLAELEREFDIPTMQNLLALTVSSAKAEIAALNTAFDANNQTELRRIAHRMIGTFGQYGAIHASLAARKLQSCQFADIMICTDEMLQAGNSAITALESFVGKFGDKTKIPA